MRRAGLLSALLLTAVLLYTMPGLLSSFVLTDSNRMDERLRPAKSRTLTIWLVNAGMDDAQLISELCSDLEKAEKGLRVFLRRVDADDLNKPDIVLPDGVLYGIGDFIDPASHFLPLADVEGVREEALGAGRSGGVLYALPLWLSPNVLSLPTDWLEAEAHPGATPQPESFFGLHTPVPESPAPAPDFTTLPWRRLMEPNALWIRPGVAWQQLLFSCPTTLRAELSAACVPTDAPASKNSARAWRLKDHLAAVKAGEALTPLLLSPAASDQLRLFSLCRDSKDGRLLLRSLISEAAASKAMQASFLPLVSTDEPLYGDVNGQAQALYQPASLLPNAFAHTRQELTELCRDGWTRVTDPVQTLLKLR